MIFTSNSPVAPFQMHSRDYFVRLTSGELDQLRLQHLVTTEDAAILEDAPTTLQPVRAGSTEWQGEFRGQVVSLAWDWIETRQGTIEPLTAVPPRTNLMVIDPKGYDLTDAAAVAAVWRFLVSVEWQGSAAHGGFNLPASMTSGASWSQH